jgi:hypothetical protein
MMPSGCRVCIAEPEAGSFSLVHGPATDWAKTLTQSARESEITGLARP